MTRGQNRLGAEHSPYLRQHKDNPVWWYPWGEAAFSAAREQNKPIFLSIGYSTCYWCHVMEKDSFEREEVAAALNKDFIAVKIDREERPDVDQIYMDAVVGLTGHGGWPMSVFLTPEGKPFWGGTFFYRDQFLKVLSGLGRAWREDNAKVLASGSEIAAALAHTPERVAVQVDAPALLERARMQLLKTADAEHGGFGSAPKFPPTQQCLLLLSEWTRTGNPELQATVIHTLTRMAHGGIYDQLGGGFHRYSVDAHWLVPHFEKMLYDNALIPRAYLAAYQVTREPLFAAVVRETFEYLCSEMLDAGGAFYAAEDAGEVAKEGEYYVWSWEELSQLLTTDELQVASQVYSASRVGNFEVNNILAVPREIAFEQRRDARAMLRSKLLPVRSARAHPHRDEKVLTAWNAMLITTLVKAAGVLEEPQYLARAQAAFQFIGTHLQRDGLLLRRYCDGDAAIAGFLDDYAYLIEAALALYLATGEPQYCAGAVRLQDVVEQQFALSNGGYRYSTAPELLHARQDLMDNATPAASSVTLKNLLLLAELLRERGYRARFDSLLALVSPLLERHPVAFPSVLETLSSLEGERRLLVIAEGSSRATAIELEQYLRQHFMPGVTVVRIPFGSTDRDLPTACRGRGSTDGKTRFFLCREGACELPTEDWTQIVSQLSRLYPAANVA